MCLLTVEPYNQAHALTAPCRIDSGGVTVAIRRSGKRGSWIFNQGWCSGEKWRALRAHEVCQRLIEDQSVTACQGKPGRWLF